MSEPQSPATAALGNSYGRFGSSGMDAHNDYGKSEQYNAMRKGKGVGLGAYWEYFPFPLIATYGLGANGYSERLFIVTQPTFSVGMKPFSKSVVREEKKRKREKHGETRQTPSRRSID